MIFFYTYLFLFQLFNTYLGVLAPLNPYVFSIIFILYGFRHKIKIINVNILLVLLFLIIAFIIIYSVKFTLASSITIAAKAIQFNYGYYFLIPGLTVFFGFFPRIKIIHILSATFWAISIELLIEFLLIRLLGVSPGAFTHYPKTQHITLDQVTGEYTANRLLGMAGNASVTGVLYTSSFVLYLGALYLQYNNLKTRKIIIVIVTFLICFFMIISGSAFFAVLLATVVIWSQRKGNLIRNLIIGFTIIPSVLILFNYLSTVTDAFGDKFTTEYLILLFVKDDIEGSLPYLLHEMSKDYHWYHFFTGSYYFEWGNPDAIIKTVDYFYVNVIYEFGIFGLIIFFVVISKSYRAIADLRLIDNTFLKFGFLVLIFGSLHYPAIAYMSSQVFVSSLAAVAIRDRMARKIIRTHRDQYISF